MSLDKCPNLKTKFKRCRYYKQNHILFGVYIHNPTKSARRSTSFFKNDNIIRSDIYFCLIPLQSLFYIKIYSDDGLLYLLLKYIGKCLYE